METYIIPPTTIKVSMGRRVLAVFLIATMYTGFMFAFEWIWPRSGTREEPAERVIFAVLEGTGFAILLLWFQSKQAQSAAIYVDADEIHEIKGGTKMNFMNSARTVRRGKVRTTIERRHGLFLSEYGRVGAFFLGGVLIPRRMEQYEMLKILTESWMKV